LHMCSNIAFSPVCLAAFAARALCSGLRNAAQALQT